MSLFEQTYKNNTRIISGLVNVPFQDDLVLLCNTSLAPVAIQLVDIPANQWNSLWKLYIVDNNANASVNNITITAPVGYLINGVSSFVITVNNGSLIVRITSNTNYIGQYSVVGNIGGYSTIQDEGVSLTQRTTLDFQGLGVTASDNGVKTVITIDGGYSTVQDEGVALPQRNIIDFVGAGVSSSDTGIKTIITINGGYATIQEEGVSLPQRSVLNFVGERVTVADTPTATVVTLDSSISVANTAYVMKNGSDATGIVGRFDKPFLTIVSAVNAIRTSYPDAVRTPSNRFKVIVQDGTYNENTIFLYPYIDFDFGNSVLIAHLTDNFIGTVTYSVNVNKDFTTKIYGNARLFKGSTSVLTLLVVNPVSRILVQCDTISSNADDAVATFGGYLKIICNQIYQDSANNVYGHAVELQQNSTVAGIFPKSTLDIVGATIYMLNNTVASTINFGNIGVVNTPDLDQTLNLYNCTVINDLGGAPNNKAFSAISCGTTHSCQVGSKLNLYNTVLYSKFGKSIFVSNLQARAHLDVYYYGTNCGNNAPYIATVDANHTLLQKITTLLVDSNVNPIIP